MFENIKWIAENIIGETNKGFVIRKNVSTENIETCNGQAVADSETKTCGLCVALNDTVFMNNNKPEYYHPKCKCKQKKYNLNKLSFDFPMQKITHYLFVNENKKAMMRRMGYIIDDYQEVYDLIVDAININFLSGNYSLQALNEHGQHVTINFVLKGKRDHDKESFNCHIGCVAWPYGKIKIATPLLLD